MTSTKDIPQWALDKAAAVAGFEIWKPFAANFSPVQAIVDALKAAAAGEIG